MPLSMSLTLYAHAVECTAAQATQDAAYPLGWFLAKRGRDEGCVSPLELLHVLPTAANAEFEKQPVGSHTTG